MTDEKNPSTPPSEQKQPSTEKQNNPFREQEKHGDEAQRRAPGAGEEYQGDQPEKRRAPGAEDDVEDDTEEKIA